MKLRKQKLHRWIACGLFTMLACTSNKSVTNDFLSESSASDSYINRTPKTERAVFPDASAVSDTASVAFAVGDTSGSVTAAQGETLAALVRVRPRRRPVRSACEIQRGSFHLGDKDRESVFVTEAEASDLLVRVNRTPTGTLDPDYVPADLVDAVSFAPRTAIQCEKARCLTRDAALALAGLTAAMRTRGFAASLESGYRSYGIQCGTFLRWADHGSFCDATEQSALPGHSQHQLGTAVDLFTEAWRTEGLGNVFRSGFGCTPAAAFLRDEAWAYGFVVPYPIHPQDQVTGRACEARSSSAFVGINPLTGYKPEPWHLRFIGTESARDFHDAQMIDANLTLETWLQIAQDPTSRETDGDAELPVCDGCNCGACATVAASATGALGVAASEVSFARQNPSREAPLDSPCGHRSIILGDDGQALISEEPPRIVSLHSQTKRAGRVTVDYSVLVPERTLTQTPLVGGQVRYEPHGSYESTHGVRYGGLKDAWRVAFSSVPGDGFPYRFALSREAAARVYDKANVRLPAMVGTQRFRVDIPAGTGPIRIGLVRDSEPVQVLGAE